MPQNPIFYSDGHVPRRTDNVHTILEKILGAIIDGSGGGGGGGVGVTGLNYCFSGAILSQTLQIKNQDTGLYNPVHTIGADGLQTVTLDNGAACST